MNEGWLACTSEYYRTYEDHLHHPRWKSHSHLPYSQLLRHLPPATWIPTRQDSSWKVTRKISTLTVVHLLCRAESNFWTLLLLAPPWRFPNLRLLMKEEEQRAWILIISWEQVRGVGLLILKNISYFGEISRIIFKCHNLFSSPFICICWDVGQEAFPMGVSSQAGKSKPITGVYLR